MAKATSKKGSLFIQPEGPNTELYYLGCHTMGDLVDSTGGALTPFYCWDASGNGWELAGELESPPDKISFTIDTRIDAGGSLDWTEILSCPFSVYVALRDCGRRDNFANNVRAWIMPEAKKLATTYSNLVTMEEDAEMGMSTTFEAASQLIKPVEVAVSQQIPPKTIAPDGTLALNDVSFNNVARCEGECGDARAICTQGQVVGDSAATPNKAEQFHTVDAGTTWVPTVLAQRKFAVDIDIYACAQYYVGRTTLRYLVISEPTATPASYSDDGGVTWATAYAINPLGGAADGATSGGTLVAYDEHHIWLAGAVGYIWFSKDAGLTWEAMEEGIVTAQNYSCLSFDPTGMFGFAVALGAPTNDLTAMTSDGGLSWTAGTTVPTAASGALMSCARLDRNRIWVGDNGGDLWWSDDGSTSWTNRLGWLGAGAGAGITDIQFVNDHVAWMTVNAGGPIGWVFRTINGGLTWDRLVTPTNQGINQLWACDENHAFFVGEATAAANSFIAYAQPA